MYTVFESKSDLYPIPLQLVEEYWKNNGKYHINEEILKSLSSKLKYLDYESFGIKGDLKEAVSKAFIKFIERRFTIGEHDNIGVAIAPYLFTWNIKRFKKYFQEKPQFNLSDYFIALGQKISELKVEIAYYRKKRLVDSDIDSDEPKIRELLKAVIRVLRELSENYVGKKQDEPLATIKILHILAPNYFPLWDNYMARCVGLKRVTLDGAITWMKMLRLWLQNYVDVLEKLEKEFKLPMLKLVDESFYIMCTVNLRKRVGSLGIPHT